MRTAIALAVVASLSGADGHYDWEEKADNKGVKVYARKHEGTDVRELKAVGEIDASPLAVFRVLTDFEHYKDTMPYTEESLLVGTEEESGKVRAWYLYSLVNAPLVSRRDYVVRVADESDWKEGKGYLKTHWTLSEKGPPPKKGVVRVPVNEGSWLLEPTEDGKKTHATYLLFTDPGGALPIWIANKANSSAIPDVFVALRKHAKVAPYAEIK